jgi:hypothetical protein
MPTAKAAHTLVHVLWAHAGPGPEELRRGVARPVHEVLAPLPSRPCGRTRPVGML